MLGVNGSIYIEILGSETRLFRIPDRAPAESVNGTLMQDMVACVFDYG
jgi:hypothetical protein